MSDKRSVYVTKERSDGSVIVVRRFKTVREAEQYIDGLSRAKNKAIREAVFEGHYGIDAPAA